VLRLLTKVPAALITELTIGKVLGRGGFCVVSNISNIKLIEGSDTANGDTGNSRSLHDEHQIHNIVQDRNFMEMYCIRKGKDTRYAIKQLQESSFKDHHTFINGIVDLAIEARFLAVIRHPNIIKMRAME